MIEKACKEQRLNAAIDTLFELGVGSNFVDENFHRFREIMYQHSNADQSEARRIVFSVRAVVCVAEFPWWIRPSMECGDATVTMQHRASRRVHIDTLILIFRSGVSL